MTDLVLKGGEVLDPSQDLHGQYDIAITNGLIERIAPVLPVEGARRWLDVRGKLVVPGLVDMHVHCYEGVMGAAINPDIAGVASGVTTIVDGGSAGPDTFQGFMRHIHPTARTSVFSFVHLSSAGLIRMPEVRHATDLDPDAVVQRSQEHPGVVVGVKVRFITAAYDAAGLEVVRMARRAAREAGTRVMMHIGDNGAPSDSDLTTFTRQAIELLEPGDIITHVFTPHPGRLVDEHGQAVPEVKEATRAGILLDPAFGRFNFGWEPAKRLLDQGVTPHVISTDMTVGGRAATVFSLTEMMGRFMALGFTLEQVVRMTTVNPARALGLHDRIGSLAPGRAADVSVLQVVDGRWEFNDIFGATETGAKAIVPVVTIKSGQMMPVDYGPHPWGWLPPPGPNAVR